MALSQKPYGIMIPWDLMSANESLECGNMSEYAMPAELDAHLKRQYSFLC